MKTHIFLRGRSRALFIGIALFLAAFALRSEAQQYAINWYKVAGGGGASSNAPFVVHGTIGQHDASEKLTGGAYTLTGGFWAMVAVQSPGSPLLSIQLSNPTTALVMWPAPAPGFRLQKNADLSTTNWTDVPTNTLTVLNGQNQITVSPIPGNQFYRLIKP
jgi:hypothetical protein